MKLLRLVPFVLPLIAGATPTDPVGIVALKLRGNSDTLVSLPILRPSLVESSIQSTATGQITLTATVPPIPSDSGAYALVLTGALEGAVLPITNVNGVSTLTVAPGAYDLTKLHSESVNGTGHGDLAAVVPYWTLDTVFPNGTGINISASPLARNTEVQLYGTPLPGIQNSPSAVFYYYSGNSLRPAGWYQLGVTTLMGSQRLVPGVYFIVRNKIAGDQTAYLSGCVQMAGFSIPIGTLSANLAQDNPVSPPIGAPLALASANLVTSGAFAASASSATIADELLTFDNTVLAQNKSPAATYYYCSGATGQPAGWYKEGAALTPVAVTLSPSEAIIIRKKAAATPQTTFWTAIPPYLQ